MYRSRPSRSTSWLWVAVCALGVGLLGHPARAAAQQSTVTGTVTNMATGQPIAGVTVQVTGSANGAVTDAAGRYSVRAPADGTLSFSHVGYTAVQAQVSGRSTVDVQMQEVAVKLNELVVTGYQTQRRGDITSAVATVDQEAVQKQSSSSVLQRLAGAVPGVTVENSGSPGSRTTLRIRGITSFQNNDPLYVIDGTPTTGDYLNFINPNDIESMQVLKDASAASIYGARASNGVVIITTKKGTRGGAPAITVDAQFGLTSPTNGYDQFLIQNPLDYATVLKLSYENAGQTVPTNIYGDPNNPTIPKYIWASPGVPVTQTDEWGRPVTVDESAYSYPNLLIMPGSSGNDWWKDVFGTGSLENVNLAARGGTEHARYAISTGYFNQYGTAIGNRYQRGTVRVNSDFNVRRFTFGENFSAALDESYGGQNNDDFGEGGIIGKNILMQTVIPVYDVGGNYASGKAPRLGNDTNPVKIANNSINNPNTSTTIFGNAYASYDVGGGLSVRSSLGINDGTTTYRGYNFTTPENVEPTTVNGIYEGNTTFWNWTWDNTANLVHDFGNHHVNALIGTEAIGGRSRSVDLNMPSVVADNSNGWYIQPALGDYNSMRATSDGAISSLLSYFGKVDYNYNNKYFLSGTVRRDGSSRLGVQWGTFPAFSAGWRLSEEPFLRDNNFITNLMLRFGWGVTGNQNIATGRTVSGFGGATDQTFYNINGDGKSYVTGYRQTSIGNPNLKWEENRSTNVGMDMDFFGGSASLVLDLYQRNSDNLLFNPPLPATAGQASAPIVNIGEVRNRGIDAALSLRGNLRGGASWTADLNVSHYKNEITRIDGVNDFFYGPIGTRYSPHVTINEIGHPIGAFYGLKAMGYFQTQAQIDQLNAAAKAKTGDTTAIYEVGAQPGRIMFADINGDGVVTNADQTIIGSPHPDLTTGLNLGLNVGRFDFAANVFGSFGNQIYNVQKEFTVFRNFDTNVRSDLVKNSWTCAAQPDPETGACPNGAKNPNAKYPRLDVSDQTSYQASSYYVEDGSYVRLRSLQVGYTVPPRLARGLDNVRVYLRGENLFTITGYSGLDPSLPALNANSSVGDTRDQAMGIDRGVYPTNRVFSVGFNVGF